jgi:hypothetical protein
MAVPLPIKIYIAKNYGDGRRILSDTGDKLGAACMLEESNPGTGLARPLPEGYGVEDICNEEVITWAYENVGWEIPEAEEPPDAIKEYIVKNYGDGQCITSDTGDKLGAACMLEESNPGTGLARPLPEGYDVEDICKENVITWAYDNVGWCLAAPPAEKGYLTVTSDPSGADIYVDDTYVGVTPLYRYELSPGTYTVRVSKSGYEDYTTTVTITAGQETTVSATLEPITPSETLLCVRAVDKATGEEVNAWIFIDGEFTGKSTPECLEVSPGTRMVKLQHSLYKTVEKAVPVVAGQTNEVTIEMEKIPYGEPIEIIVIAPCADDEFVRPILEPPYSDIPTTIMKGTLTRFRIFFINNGLAAPLDETKTYIYIEKPDTGERYYFNMIEADIDKTIDARGQSIRFEGTVPLTASTGTYNMFLEWDVKVPPEQRCKS